MDSVVDIIRNAAYVEQQHDIRDLEIENELRHPFSSLKNSFDRDENGDIELSETHTKTTSAFCDESTDRWGSVDDIFKKLHVEDYPSELSSNVKSCLKEMLFKPDLNIKCRENLGRKFSSSSDKKGKPEWKSNIIKGSIRDAKTERKLSLLFSSRRKRSSVNENVEKKIEENILKIGKRGNVDGIESRKCSTDGKMKRKGTDESVAVSRKQSSLSQKLDNQPSKKLELNVNEFLLSSSHYNRFNDVNEQQISKSSIPWSLKERTRIKVTHWLSK